MKKMLLTIVVITALVLAFGSGGALAQRSSRGGGGNSSGQNAARQAQSRVLAVADQRTNSLVVSAPDELMPLIEQLIGEIDGVANKATEIDVFPLRYADATEMAQTITSVFDIYGYSSQGRGRSIGRGSQRSMQSERQMEEDMVIAVADVRTNSVVVTAVREKMQLVGKMINQLDTDPSKDRKVFIYSIENANPESIQGILQNMFQGGTGARRTTTTRPTSRQNTTTQRGGAAQSTRGSGQSQTRQ